MRSNSSRGWLARHILCTAPDAPARTWFGVIGASFIREVVPMYSVILAAVDGSSRSVGVVDAALQVAERFAARIPLFQAVSVPPAFPPAAVTLPDELPKQLEAETRQSLEQLRAGHPRILVEAPD